MSIILTNDSNGIMNTPCIMLRYSDNKTLYINATSISRCSYNATLQYIVIT